MNPISIEDVASAVNRICSLSASQKKLFLEKISQNQRYALAYAFVLEDLGISASNRDHVLHLVMVLYECFRNSVNTDLPTISQEALESRLKSMANKVNFSNGNSPRNDSNGPLFDWLGSSEEKNVVAYVAGYLVEEAQILKQGRESKPIIEFIFAFFEALVNTKRKAGGGLNSEPQNTYVRLVLNNNDSTPYANKKYQLTLDGKVYLGKTDAEGLLEEAVPQKLTKGWLTLWPDESNLEEVIKWPITVNKPVS